MKHNRWLCSALLTVSLASTGFYCQAQTSACSDISDRVERIRCQMDNIAEETSVSNTWEPAEKKWRISSSKSEMTDEKGVYGSLQAEGAVSCGVLGVQKTPSLRVMCHENETRVILDVGCFMADSAGFGEVRLRADDNKMKIMHFNESNNNEALGLWGARSSRPFIDYIVDSKSLLIEFAPYEESRQTARFKTDGIAIVVAAVRKQCGW